jgi:phage terminase Nu1 subunit (DNA packaging protein)
MALPETMSEAKIVIPKNVRAPALAKATAERGRLAAAQADLAELKACKFFGELVEATAVEREGSDILRTVRAGMLAVPSRVAQRLPHLAAYDIAEIDTEVRAALSELGNQKVE